MSAAALSAAVDARNTNGERTTPSGGTNSAEAYPAKRQPLFGRGGLGERPLPPEETRGWGNAGGGRFSKRSASPRPPPEE